ncbi:hypothetical protein CS542_09340 [Pedobacter sp. IW39]|nr:hypothetical protein CS542_09340 [Pedobacter sp. IW39]
MTTLFKASSIKVEVPTPKYWLMKCHCAECFIETADFIHPLLFPANKELDPASPCSWYRLF